MKRTLFFALLAFVVGCTSQHSQHSDSKSTEHDQHQKDPHAGHSMDQGNAMLMIQTEPAHVTAGKSTSLKMMIHGADGKMLKDFAVVHEQKVHLIIVRDGLDQFAHLHPEIDAAGNLTTTYTFPTGGTYRLYADHQPVGGSPATATDEVKVAGETPPTPSLKPDVPGRVKGDSLNADVSVSRPKPGDETMIRFEITDLSGTPVADLQTYLGAMGHLVVISQDGKHYVHAHPLDENKSNSSMVTFGAHFPQPGPYKGWGQFKRQGQVRIVPFVVQVDG